SHEPSCFFNSFKNGFKESILLYNLISVRSNSYCPLIASLQRLRGDSDLKLITISFYKERNLLVCFPFNNGCHLIPVGNFSAVYRENLISLFEPCFFGGGSVHHASDSGFNRLTKPCCRNAFGGCGSFKFNGFYISVSFSLYL